MLKNYGFYTQAITYRNLDIWMRRRKHLGLWC